MPETQNYTSPDILGILADREAQARRKAELNSLPPSGRGREWGRKLWLAIPEYHGRKHTIESILLAELFGPVPKAVAESEYFVAAHEEFARILDAWIDTWPDAAELRRFLEEEAARKCR